jgi:hypothetical protein
MLDFFSLLVSRPDEAFGRLEGVIDSRLERLWVKAPQYKADQLERVLAEVEQTLGIDLMAHFHELGLTEIQNKVREGINRLPENAPFPRFNNGDFALGRLCYALCRALRPAQVLETGVCYGVTTAFVLKAMQQNQSGMLHSIDLPPLGRQADVFVGVLVPEELRSRWQLHRGTTKSILPKLLDRIGPLNFFVHDSLHTYRNMKRELLTITPSLSRPAVVVSDDIESNPAFSEWAKGLVPAYWGAVQEDTKASLLGIAVLTSSESILKFARAENDMATPLIS